MIVVPTVPQPIPSHYVRKDRMVEWEFFSRAAQPNVAASASLVQHVRDFLPHGCFLAKHSDWVRASLAKNINANAVWSQARIWIEENTRAPWLPLRLATEWHIFFAHDHDAVHFTLRFPEGIFADGAVI